MPLNKPVPQKLKLTPNQAKILWLLEEAGAESIPTILATLQPLDLDEFACEISRMLDRNLVRFYFDRSITGENYSQLAADEQIDPSKLRELFTQTHSSRNLGLMLTDSGQTALET